LGSIQNVDSKSQVDQGESGRRFLVDVVIVVADVGAVCEEIGDAVVADDRVLHRHESRQVVETHVLVEGGQATGLVVGPYEGLGEPAIAADVRLFRVGLQAGEQLPIRGVGGPYLFIEARAATAKVVRVR
jgi:hypothetical protein